MRLPSRTRGVAAGLFLLAVSPIIAVSASHHGAVASRQTPGAPVAVTASRVVPGASVHLLLPPHDPSIGIADETPAPPPVATPAPPPVATHVPAPVRVVKPAPTPRPSAAVPSYSAGTVQAIIVAAAQKWGVDPTWMLSIARCESGFNPRAYNPAGPYIGLFQFLPSTFSAHGGTNIYDPVQQSDITANMLAHGGARAWSCA